MRRLAFTDSHGGLKAIIQCLERCNYDPASDELYFLGDCSDGWSETKETIEFFMTLKKFTYLIGNHDQWTLAYYCGEMTDENEYASWQYHGGLATRQSYGIGNPMPEDHFKFLANAKSYHVTEDNILMVHAGYDVNRPIEMQDVNTLIWHRYFAKQIYTMWSNSHIIDIPTYKEVYIGHTPTTSFSAKNTKPLVMGNVIMVDTGSCFNGKLSIIDIDTKEVWQSDTVRNIYHTEKGRNKLSVDEENKQMGI